MYDYLYLNSIRDGCQAVGRLDSYLTGSAKRSGFGLPASGYSGKVTKWLVHEKWGKWQSWKNKRDSGFRIRKRGKA
jgi:hypothetical protein